MHSFFIAVSMVVLLLGCQTNTQNETCEALYDELVKSCQFEAPSYGSCMDGCAYNQAEGKKYDA